MKKFSTVLMLLFIYGSVTNLTAAITWMGNQEINLASSYTHNNTTDVLKKTYTVQVAEAGVTDSPGEGTAIDCFLVYHYNHGITVGYNFDGPDTEIPMTYTSDVGANDKYFVEWAFAPKVAAKIEVYFKCVNGASTWYQDNSGANGQATHAPTATNFVWDLGITSPDGTSCNFNGGWTHPLYTFHTEFGANADWFTTNVGLAEPTIQGDGNYAQATVKAVNTNSSFIWQKDFKYDNNIRRWVNTNFPKNTCATATNIDNDGSGSTSVVTGGITVDNYYTLRFRRTLTDGNGGDAYDVRAFSLMETTTPPIRITSMEAAGARISTEEIDDDVDARGVLKDRNQTCSPGNAIKLYDGNLYRPSIKMNQGVSVTGTYSGNLGNQHVYVRYIRQDANNDKITKCTAGSGNFSCTIPQADLVAGSQWNYYVFVAPIDFTSISAGAVNTATNAVTDGSCLDLLSLDWWGYQIAEASVAAKQSNITLAEKFRRTPNRNFEFQVSSTLPISLTTLTAAVSGNGANLEWRTASETNNAGFYVEHRLPNGTWKNLGFVEGKGTSTVENTYIYPVKDMPYGYNTFRLKQVDKDGIGQYSNDITVLVELPDTALLNNTYPNPFSQSATVEFAVAATQNVQLELFNILGQKVQTLYNGSLTENTMTKASINAGTLANGTYILRLTGDNFVKTQSVVVIK